jgi:hypothetical protein
MGKVTVRNMTQITVKIQEGNAGLFVTRHVLKKQAEFTLDLDANATYREYVLITLPDNTPLQQMFSSDDVAEFREILIKEQDVEPKYFWEGILRGQKSEPNQPDEGKATLPAGQASVGAQNPSGDQGKGPTPEPGLFRKIGRVLRLTK